VKIGYRADTLQAGGGRPLAKIAPGSNGVHPEWGTGSRIPDAGGEASQGRFVSPERDGSWA
jgi:hypothetical protein